MSQAEIAVELLNSQLENLFNFGRGLYESHDEKRKIKIGQAYQRYILNARSKLSKTKSFFVLDKPADFYDYYVSTTISCGGVYLENPGISRCVNESDRIVIAGTGGCGKSVFMRHLFLDCIKQMRFVPVLIELRDLNDSVRTVDEHVFYTLENGGFDVGGSFVRRSMEYGNFCFLFDGFDELVEPRRNEVGDYIKEISLRYSGCPVIVSSRPDERFNGWNQFSVFSVEPLSKKAAISLVKKLPVEKEVKDKFLRELDERLYEEHQSFLSNPLLLSIMLLTYHQNAEVPSKLSVFYSQAYEALFQKHDATKGAYSRSRSTSLDILDFSKVFSLFSLLTYDNRIFRMSKVDCLEFIEESKKRLGADFDRQDFLSDLLGATCMLVEDGLQVAYSHRSFQEYFVSLYILGESLEVQTKLIDRFWEPTGSDSVIALLYEQNPALVERVLLIPYLEKAFRDIGVVSKVTHKSHFEFLRKSYEMVQANKNELSFMFHMDDSSKRRIALGIIGTAVTICGRWSKAPSEVYRALSDAVFKELNGEGDYFSFRFSNLREKPKVLKLLRDSETSYGINYLTTAFNLYKELKEKHSNHAKSLFDLLDGSK
ncbi:NACHT domain-containing protein [Pseudomonas marginalis]|nr:NACHT domain-containing protein [Pseudomonas marginalis]